VEEKSYWLLIASMHTYLANSSLVSFMSIAAWSIAALLPALAATAAQCLVANSNDPDFVTCCGLQLTQV
jgi:hypothetical protein